MVEFKPLFNKHIEVDAPNVTSQILRHPFGLNISIELSTFNHHRYAFYSWAKWCNEYRKDNQNLNFDLVTYDWHQDLVYPCDKEKEYLESLDISNSFELSFFSTYRLNPLNHNHIMSAAYLNLINDVWVLCRQDTDFGKFEDEYITDYRGEKHTIRKFKNVEDLKNKLFQSRINHVFFDIDLDYFTIINDVIDFKNIYTYMKDKEIKNLLSYDNELTSWILNRTYGITIALEPKYTGGISKSMKYLSLIENLWFNRPIGNWDVEWKHLK
ncbi:hypothetical protein [Olleya sp. Hel_I_94]|uniref:hypothetical protein n=1 Tax=Olleya sp. Hel_I_94 TaxID=1250001 RepID=UPI0011AA1964|nr:hypothetical protein [Olleya sp. Hel_I_94]TVZ48645.1 hypothetical protein JM82_3295 [Olleya sp. Hel_I_94]